MSRKGNPQEVEPVESQPQFKKEEIYESAEQESPMNVQANMPNQKAGKKEPKLLTFLAKIDPEFEEEMERFLLKNQEEYGSRGNPAKICLYEDILFIWGFKKAEADLKRNKREAV